MTYTNKGEQISLKPADTGVDKHENSIESCYRALATAIAVQAVEDYEASLKKLKKNANNQDARIEKEACEKFFKSGWFITLTDGQIDGEVAMDAIKKRVAA